MLGPWQPFRGSVGVTSAGAAYDDVTFGPVREDREYHLDRIVVEDQTSAPTGSIRLRIDGHGVSHPIEQQAVALAATPYVYSDPVFLLPGESLVARITGATSGDKLQLSLEGRYAEPVAMMGA